MSPAKEEDCITRGLCRRCWQSLSKKDVSTKAASPVVHMLAYPHLPVAYAFLLGSMRSRSAQPAFGAKSGLCYCANVPP